MILLLSVRMLDDRFHGLAANGERPNWPPSCFRLFQAIVAGNARGDAIPLKVVEALKWLETLPPPIIVVPTSKAGKVTLTYVLNNTENRSRTQKLLRPTLLNGDRLIEFAWQYDPSEGLAQNHAQVLLDAVRHIRAFGWGIDLAIGHGVILERLPELSLSRFRFFPRTYPDAPGIEIRVPTSGSMDSLIDCYRQYLRRFESNNSTLLESGGPLYQPWPYTTGFSRPHAVFKLVDESDDAYRYPHAKLVHIAGMVRHLAIQSMTGNPPRSLLQGKDHADWVNRVVRGKRDESSSDDHKQFSYTPLPSIGHTHSDAMVRNVMVVAPLGMERELSYLAEQLDGQVLKPEHDSAVCETDSSPLLSGRVELRKFAPPRGKFILTHYLNEPGFGRSPSRTWQSVTPVILPGHNDKKAGKTIKLIQAALHQAGIDTPCDFTWQAVPFFKNCLSAHKYDRSGRHTGYHRPAHLKDLTAVHVSLQFEYAVPGPVAIGAGRHCGFGLMAAVED